MNVKVLWKKNETSLDTKMFWILRWMDDEMWSSQINGEKRNTILWSTTLHRSNIIPKLGHSLIVEKQCHYASRNFSANLAIAFIPQSKKCSYSWIPEARQLLPMILVLLRMNLQTLKVNAIECTTHTKINLPFLRNEIQIKTWLFLIFMHRWHGHEPSKNTCSNLKCNKKFAIRNRFT